MITEGATVLVGKEELVVATIVEIEEDKVKVKHNDGHIEELRTDGVIVYK